MGVCGVVLYLLVQGAQSAICRLSKCTHQRFRFVNLKEEEEEKEAGKNKNKSSSSSNNSDDDDNNNNNNNFDCAQLLPFHFQKYFCKECFEQKVS
jgi:hypothetical protein